MKDNFLNIVSGVHSIFRSSLIWNFSFPFFAGILINASLIDFRQFVIFVVWVPLLCLPYLVFKKKCLILFPWVLTFLFGFLDLINWVSIKTPLTEYSLFVILESSMSEATSFIDLKWSYLYLFVPVYIIGSLYLLFRNFKAEIKTSKIIGALFVAFSIIFILENAYNERFIRKSTPKAVAAVSNFYTEMLTYQNKAKDIELYLGKVNSTALDLENEQVTVIVIGESTTRKKMSLYGYEKETTPLLQKRDDIAVYTDVISPFTHTQASVRTCLTYSNVENSIAYTKAQSIIDLARASDFETYWISNQASMGIWDNLVALLAKTSENVTFVNQVLNSQKLLETATYDEKVLAPFAEALQEKGKKKLIILHLMGTHATYHKRYPDRFNFFAAALETEQAIQQAQYNNAVLYNDFVVNSIIDSLKKYSELNSSLANLVFFSDHGENVYDDERQLSGHDWWKLPSEYLVEIPFVVWTSSAYKKQFSVLDSIIYTQTNRSFSNDNFFHSALDLMHIESDLFEDSLSLFSPNFTKKERFVEKKIISYENEVLKGELLYERLN